ncbi:MAG: hypothetical protein KC609_03595 [Myxococcales bacterium]|nr:hypothetical protein [Myxococcales bacterium]
MQEKKERTLQLMKEVLNEDYLHLDVSSFEIHEDAKSGRCRIHCTLQSPLGEVTHVEGAGVGMIDAFFQGFKERLAHEFPSLNTISFSEFGVKAIMSTKGDTAGSDAVGEVELAVTNSYGSIFRFTAQSRSISRASLTVTLEAMEYFVNSERTFCRLYQALQHYRKEGRTDLVAKYTDLLSSIVENTSYSEVIEQIKHELQF